MSTPDEIWLPVAGQPHYEVSNLGRIRSLDRESIMMCRWGFTILKKKPGRILKPTSAGKYLAVRFTLGGTNQYIHRIVALAFIPLRDGALEVNHKDGNRKNNAVENLEWMTRLENVHHYWRNLAPKTA